MGDSLHRIIEADGDAAPDTLAIEHAHDLAMSRNPYVACQGRLSKIIINAVTPWLEAEMARGTPPEFMLGAARSAAFTLFFTTLCNAIPAGAKAHEASLMRERFIALHDNNIEALRRLEAPGEEVADKAMGKGGGPCPS